tara:strand:+ start:6884 stop:9685 length:2802 start_codon:yes stop_codon:yes gene_type:complete
MVGASFLKKIFGSRNQRIVKKYQKQVVKINAFENSLKSLSDEELKNKTAEFKARLAKKETLDDLLPEAFAVVREASVRTLKMRHFDVQMIGGMVLNHGKIAEMHTGEGKTLVATLPAYLNALTGNSVHVITVNDYLAKRDSEWMTPVFNFLGLSVDVVITNQSPDDKKKAYSADIVYGTNNEFGFDYLRDNMTFSLEDKAQGKLSFAIIDEVDSILIDEARTPLIISGPAEESSEIYGKINKIIPGLKKGKVIKADTGKLKPEIIEVKGSGDYIVDEKEKQVYFTEEGHEKVEALLVKHNILQEGESLYSASNISLMHYLSAALKAYTLFQKDVDYIVQDDEIVIVDEHTGRTMPGRRWSDGLHQAVEAKEGVKIQNENQTLATITFQNFFRLYDKLSGMTGTADTEAYEFQQIYNLEVVVIPTNRNIQRIDNNDKVFMTVAEKYESILEDLKQRQAKGQPVLVGTASIEASEHLSNLLKKNKIKHNVLNAKFHQKEAQIIIDAGRPGIITIATNMAGRGTDIVLGGSLKAELAKLENPTNEQIAELEKEWKENNAKVLKAGGLYVLGSERHESRRIDNQLRGRSGRQGDPGEARFYLSFEDNLLRIFATPRPKMMQLLKSTCVVGEALPEMGMLNRMIEGAQRKVEGFNFEIRKHLLEYDDVANEQRKVVYAQRNFLMGETSITELVSQMLAYLVEKLVDAHIPEGTMEEQWSLDDLDRIIEQDLAINDFSVVKLLDEDHQLSREDISSKFLNKVTEIYKAKEDKVGLDIMRQFEKNMMLQILDTAWKEHLVSMTHLRQGINLRAHAQKDPKQEYKRESFNLFSEMLDAMKYQFVTNLLKVELLSEEELRAIKDKRKEQENWQQQHITYKHDEPDELLQGDRENDNDSAKNKDNVVQYQRNHPKMGRNEQCFCGSGKKYKNCHGSLSVSNEG